MDLAALEVEFKASLACPMECGDCLMNWQEEMKGEKLLFSLQERREERKDY